MLYECSDCGEKFLNKNYCIAHSYSSGHQNYKFVITNNSIKIKCGAPTDFYCRNVDK